MRVLGLLGGISILMVSVSSFAALLSTSPGSQEIEGVKVSQGASARLQDRSYALKTVGAGLRFKKVAFFKAKVYVGELMMDSPGSFQRSAEAALASLDSQKAVAVRMTFLRDVDGEKVSETFREALKENKVSLDAPAVRAFLTAVKEGGAAKEKTTLVVLGERLPGGKEAVSYESSAGKLVTVEGGAGFLREIFSMWLGRIDDAGLESLKKGFLGL